MSHLLRINFQSYYHKPHVYIMQPVVVYIMYTFFTYPVPFQATEPSPSSLNWTWWTTARMPGTSCLTSCCRSSEVHMHCVFCLLTFVFPGANMSCDMSGFWWQLYVKFRVSFVCESCSIYILLICLTMNWKLAVDQNWHTLVVAAAYTSAWKISVLFFYLVTRLRAAVFVYFMTQSTYYKVCGIYWLLMP